MTEVKISNGKLVVNKSTTTKGNKPPKYAYPPSQYEALLKLAKGAGLDVESNKAAKTKAVNLVVKAALDDFIAQQHQQQKPKPEKA